MRLQRVIFQSEDLINMLSHLAVCIMTSYEQESWLVLVQPTACSLLHTLALWYSLLLLGYKPVQHVAELNCVAIITQW